MNCNIQSLRQSIIFFIELTKVLEVANIRFLENFRFLTLTPVHLLRELSRVCQRAAESFLVVAIAPCFGRELSDLLSQSVDDFQCRTCQCVAMEKYGVTHPTLDVGDTEPDVMDKAVKVTAELTDVVLFLGFSVQDNRLKRNKEKIKSLVI